MESNCLMLIFLSCLIPESWTSPTFYSGHPPAGSLWPHGDLQPPAVYLPESLARIYRLRNSAPLNFPRRTHSELANLGPLKFRPYSLNNRKVDSGFSPNLRSYFSLPLHNEWVSRCLKGDRCAKIIQDPAYLENSESKNSGLTGASVQSISGEKEEDVQGQGMGNVHEIPKETKKLVDEGDADSEPENSSGIVGSLIENDVPSFKTNEHLKPKQYDSEPITKIQNEPTLTQVQPENLPSIDSSDVFKESVKSSGDTRTVDGKNVSWDDEYIGDTVTNRAEVSEPAQKNFGDSIDGQNIPEGASSDLPLPGIPDLIKSTALATELEKASPVQIEQDNTEYSQSIQQKEESIPELNDSASQLGIANVETPKDLSDLEVESRNVEFDGENSPPTTFATVDSDSRQGVISVQLNQNDEFLPSGRIAKFDILDGIVSDAVDDTSSRKASGKPGSEGTSPVDKILKIPISITDLNTELERTTVPKVPILKQTDKPAKNAQEPIVISLNVFKKGHLMGRMAPDIFNYTSLLSGTEGPNFTQSSPVTINVQPIAHHHYYSPYLTPQTYNENNLSGKSESNTARQTRHSYPPFTDLSSQNPPQNSISSASTTKSDTASESIGADSEWDSIDKLVSEFTDEEKQERNGTDKRESFDRNEKNLDVRSEVISTPYPDQSATNTFSDPTNSDEMRAYVPFENSTDSNIYLFVGGQWFVNFKDQPEIFHVNGKPQQAFQPESESIKQEMPALPLQSQSFQNTLYQPAENSRPFFAVQPEYNENYKTAMHGKLETPFPNSYYSPLISARSSEYPPIDGGPLQVLDIPANEVVNNRWMFNNAYPFPPNEPASSFSYSSPDSSSLMNVQPSKNQDDYLNYEDALVNFPKNDHASPMRDDGINEEKMSPVLFKQYDVDFTDMSVIGLQLLSVVQSPDISLLDSSLRRRPINEEANQIPSRDAAGRSSSAWGYRVGNKHPNATPYTRRTQKQNWQNSQQFEPQQEKYHSNMAPSNWDALNSDRPGTFGQQLTPENSVASRPQNQWPPGTPISPYWPSHKNGDFDFVSGQYVFVRPRSYEETIEDVSGLNYRQNSRCPVTYRN